MSGGRGGGHLQEFEGWWWTEGACAVLRGGALGGRCKKGERKLGLREEGERGGCCHGRGEGRKAERGWALGLEVHLAW